MSIWNEEQQVVKEKEDSSLYHMVDNFFEEIRSSKILEYREGQHTMALDIVEAIRDKEILLIEAGVGIGKSYAYLIPILYAYQNDSNFHGFIVSTSTIALQEQLEKDIQKISEILEIPISVTVAKGKTNYVCLRKLEEFLENYPLERETVQTLLERIQNGDIDRFDFSDLKEGFWKQIHITSCSFDKCPQYSKCPYILNRKKFIESDAIICNHDLLIQNLKRGTEDEKILNNPSLLVIDEAHNLEDKVRTSYQKYLDKRHIEHLVYDVYNRILKISDPIEIEQTFFDTLNGLFSEISKNAKTNLRKNIQVDSGYEDCVRVSFQVTSKILKYISDFVSLVEKLLRRVEKYEYAHYEIIHSSSLDELRDVITVLSDLAKRTESKHAFWVEFLGKDGKYVRITYAPKEIHKITAQLLSDKNYGKVLTSATLTVNQGNYSYYMRNVGLDILTEAKLVREFPVLSPYLYKENSLIYYGNDIVNPRDKEKYLAAITERIQKLLNITEGRGLVLFTSKRDMQIVYENMDGYGYPIYMQQEGNEQQIIQRFQNEEHSSLFGTGVFWEGIDIQGSSLSHVIIPKLPFPIVEPVVQAKALVYHDGFKEVYLPEMIMKLKQGVGRLIRSETDTGIISILDSRMQAYNEKYDNIIQRNLPDANETSDIEVVQEFAKKKILSL